MIQSDFLRTQQKTLQTFQQVQEATNKTLDKVQSGFMEKVANPVDKHVIQRTKQEFLKLSDSFAQKV